MGRILIFAIATIFAAMFLSAGLLCAEPLSFEFGTYTDTKGNITPVTWYIKESEEAGPGPNRWDRSCVELKKDKKGVVQSVTLHIKKIGNVWSCAEIYTKQRFGLGAYSFNTEGRQDNFDKNVVLGMFNYAGEDAVNDAIYEIDIEVATFGGAHANPLCYGIYPLKKDMSRVEETFKMSQLTQITHHYNRGSGEVYFSSFVPSTRTREAISVASWSIDKSVGEGYITALATPVHMNLWLFRGNPPTNNKGVKITLNSFSFREPRQSRRQ